MPEEEAVDGPEGQVAALGSRAGAGDVVEEPGDLGRREIGVEQQARCARDTSVSPPSRLEVGAERRGAAILPDDRVADRPAGRPAPRRASSRAGW